MGLSEDPERVTQTQAHVARKPEIVQNMLRGVDGTELSVSDFLGDSSVSSSPGSDILTFAVTGPDPGLSERHPSVIAGVLYRDFRRERDDASIVVLRKPSPVLA